MRARVATVEHTGREIIVGQVILIPRARANRTRTGEPTCRIFVACYLRPSSQKNLRLLGL